MLKIKEFFNYKKRFKNQKHKNKRLRKKVNKLQKPIIEEFAMFVKDDEIIKLRKEITILKNQIKNLNLECQKYFDYLIEKVDE